MDILYLLIPLSIVLVAFAAIAFIWASRSGQFDDLDKEAWRIVYDDQEEKKGEDNEHHL
jgi:cbb3-type cytochrome oxidase maturation protein